MKSSLGFLDAISVERVAPYGSVTQPACHVVSPPISSCQLYEQEGSYLLESSQGGGVLRGFEAARPAGGHTS